MRLRSRDLFATIRTEGGLLPPEFLQRVADGDPDVDGLDPGSYHLPENERLNEAITRSWTRLQGAWKSFSQARRSLPADDTGASITRERWLHPLFNQLGYGRLVSQPAIGIESKRYPVFSQWQNTPIHLVGVNVPIDRRTKGVAGAAGQSPHSLVQELLNRSSERLWGIVSNGLSLRLLRDNVALTRQAFVEFDLETMMENEAYPDFVVLWLTCHQSRAEGEDPHQCWLERWSQESATQGTRALDALREGVEHAIAALGSGFLAHPANTGLQDALRDGTLGPIDYYRQILRLVYRMLFLFVAEDRDVLLVGDDREARDRFARHYSTSRLRRLAMRRRGGTHDDLFVALTLLMDKLYEEGCEALALPALGSELWNPSSIGYLAGAQIANEDLLDAIRELAFVDEAGVFRPVDFRNLGAEELGSIYESLLELHPDIDRKAAEFSLYAAAGSERKTTGSYYTPTSLISALLDSALDPVVEETVAGKSTEEAEEALLDLKVCDPACGSGHFLIAAGNRIAKRLATVRTGDSEPSPEAIRTALRDVVGRCLYGVDANPMAVELCKVSLWMEALEPGRPLSFLDHNIAYGNSLLGTTPELIDSGIPDAAYKSILGDEKEIATAWKKLNKQEHEGTQTLFDDDGKPTGALAKLAEDAAQLLVADDRNLESLREKEKQYRGLLASDEYVSASLAANAWCAAFVAEKQPNERPMTDAVVQRALKDPELLDQALRDNIKALADDYAFFHWHLAFPEVFDRASGGRGGFDAVLGNPPWERVKLQEKEFFATRSPEIASAPNKAARERLIKALSEEDPDLLAAFEAAKRQAEGASHIIRDSGRYPLCGRGDVNTYSIFAELNRSLIAAAGRVGCIVPTGIATDDTTKHFFQSLIGKRSLVSLYDFENREAIFPGVHRSQKFCLLTLTGTQRPVEDGARFIFFATRADHLTDLERRFTLTAEEIELLNPNTKTCPIFRTARDAEITKGIYRRMPVLIREGDPDGNPWGISFSTMFHMASDSHLFRTRQQLEDDGWELAGNVFVRGDERMLPLYEAKMFHHFDHRWATFDGGDMVPVTASEHESIIFAPLPRYWVRAGAIPQSSLPAATFGYRNITNVTNERTLVGTCVPPVGFGHSVILVNLETLELLPLFTAVWSSFALDYVARQKLGGTNVTYGYSRQFAIPLPFDFASLRSFFNERVLELVCTSRDAPPLSKDHSTQVGPFRWSPDRRFLLRAELDAAIFHVYSFDRRDVDHIMDTFPIVRRKDEADHGEYRTKRVILGIYDEMTAVAEGGKEYQTRLDPPPADPRMAHGAANKASSAATPTDT